MFVKGAPGGGSLVHGSLAYDVLMLDSQQLPIYLTILAWCITYFLPCLLVLDLCDCFRRHLSCQCMNAAMLMCGWNQTGDLTSLPGGLPNGRDMTCLIVSVRMLPCWCVAGIRQETWHLYLEGCPMAVIWRVLLSVYESCHIDMWLESDRRPDISTWRAAKWQRYDVSYCQCMNATMETDPESFSPTICQINGALTFCRLLF